MKLNTTDKVPHAYETFKGLEGSWTASASLSKDTACWNWTLRVYYTDAAGMQFEQGLWIGTEWSKAESRKALEQELTEQLSKAPWLG